MRTQRAARRTQEENSIGVSGYRGGKYLETGKRGGKPVIASHFLCEEISVPVKAA
ncbi:MAG: hypothetical protein RRA15_09820 [bacterium]|nr:hypothetical protein [bacterium]